MVANISVRRVQSMIRKCCIEGPSNIHTPVWGSPILLIDDTRLKSSYLWVHEMLQHLQVHGACDCRFTKKRTGRWSCLSLDRTKRSTAGRKQLIEPEPNWFSIRCNSPIHSSVILSRYTKPPFVHIAEESPFYFFFCDCYNAMTQQSTSNKWNNKFFEFLFLLVCQSHFINPHTWLAMINWNQGNLNGTPCISPRAWVVKGIYSLRSLGKLL